MSEGGFSERDLGSELSDIETKAKDAAGQAALAVLGGAVPFAGGLASWVHDKWSGKEQDRANRLFLAWFKMLQDELREKERVMAEIMSRLDMADDDTIERVSSPGYQRLVRKAFRNWNGAESDRKLTIVRNILTNAASAATSSDDVVSLFLDWIAGYSEFHFEVIAAIYNDAGITRYGIWQKLKKPTVREDSADADLYKLLIRDLSTGGVIRQHRDVDYAGNYIKKRRPVKRGSGTMKSAFDNQDPYELTELGKQFVHYALNEVTTRIEFDPKQDF